MLYSFGREEELDTNALKRLINSINRYLGPEEALASQESEVLKFISSKPLGGAFFLDGLWKRLGIKETIDQFFKNRNYQNPVERVLFAIVANRALNPKSKLAVELFLVGPKKPFNIGYLPIYNPTHCRTREVKPF